MNDQADGAGRVSAVCRDSIDSGAVISFSGDTLIATGDGIVAAIESRLTNAPSSDRDGERWLTDAVPVLVRGAAWIVPLAWVPDHPVRGDAEQQILRGRVSELWIAVRSACSYRHGDQIGIDLAANTGKTNRYASELVRTGVRRADWWAFGDSAVVLAVSGEPIPAPVSMMAVHVVPIGWVSERRPTPPKKMPILDLEWSWEDVVASASTETADAASTLGEQRKGQES